MPKTVRRRTTYSLSCGWAGWRPALRAPRGETGVEYTPAGRDATKPIVFLVARVSRGAVEIQWIDEERMAVGYWDGEVTFVDVVAVDGSRSAVGQGRLIGLMRR